MSDANDKDLKPAGGEELLDTGQEEVFARSEVESGEIEHDAQSGAHGERAQENRTQGDRARADAPVDPADTATSPPTRQGGADTGQTADDPGRGGD